MSLLNSEYSMAILLCRLTTVNNVRLTFRLIQIFPKQNIQSVRPLPLKTAAQISLTSVSVKL